MKSSSRGMTIAGMMAAMAAGAVLIALVAVLYENMTRLQLEGEIHQEADSLAHFLQDALNNPNVCRSAFRDTPGPALGGVVISWPDVSVEQPVGHIEIQNMGAGAAVMGAYTGQILVGQSQPGKPNPNPRLKIASIVLRQPMDKEQEGFAAQSIVNDGNKSYNIVSTKVVIRFAVSPAIIPQGIQERTLDVVLGLDPKTGNQIAMCYQGDRTNQFDLFCTAAMIKGGPPPHKGCPKQVSPGCSKFYYVRGFDVNSKPICACEIICSQPPVGPPGPFTGGPKGKKGGN